MASLSDNLVFLDSAPDELHFDSVVLNFQLGVEQAVDYFLEHGHRGNRISGALPEAGSEEAPGPGSSPGDFYPLYEAEGSLPSGIHAEMASPMTASASRKYLEERIAAGGPMPTAILTANEEAAIGAAGALRSCQMSIPRDLSIISFNDTPLSALTDPPLTSVSTHVEAMSATAVDLLTPSRLRTASGHTAEDRCASFPDLQGKCSG